MKIKITALSKDERGLLELWKETFPDQAHAAGLKDEAGRVAAPTAKLDQALEAKAAPLLQSEDESVAAVAQSLRAQWLFREPHVPIERAVRAAHSHLSIEGPRGGSLRGLARSIEKSFAAWAQLLAPDTTPAQALFVSWHASAFRTLGQELQGAASPATAKAFADAALALDRYAKPFSPPETDASFERTLPLLESSGAFARAETYPRLLKDLFGYPESPADIETQSLKQLRTEIGKLHEATKDLATRFDSQADARVVKRELAHSRNGAHSLVSFTEELRVPLLQVADQRIVPIAKGYDTRVLATPPYLRAVYPTAGAASFGLFTNRPYHHCYLTTDDRHAPPAGIAETFQTLVHEEIGHCVHASNSALQSGRNAPSLAELIPSAAGQPLSEGYAFNLEWMSVELLRGFANGTARTTSDEGLLRLLGGNGRLVSTILEHEFEMRYWRVLRFLRAVGDVRLNWRHEEPLRFIEWAEKETGLSKKTIFDQVFTFQDAPGYAPSYALAGERLRRYQQRAEAAGTSRRAFNAQIASMGFVSQRPLERRLRDRYSPTVTAGRAA